MALEAVSADSDEACEDFLRGLVTRGLRPPLLVVTDGAPGLIGAVEQVLRQSLRQRCLVHLVGNVVAKVTAADQAEAKADLTAASRPNGQ